MINKYKKLNIKWIIMNDKINKLINHLKIDVYI